MTETELRLECLKLACSIERDHPGAVAGAEAFMKFLGAMSEHADSAPQKDTSNRS